MISLPSWGITRPGSQRKRVVRHFTINWKKRKGKNMKRIMALALVAAFILGSVSFASAAELKVTGEFKSNAQWSSQFDLNDDNNSEDEFNIKSRARIIFRYSASDNLSAVLRIQYGTIYWGDPNTGGLIDTDSNKIGRAHV